MRPRHRGLLAEDDAPSAIIFDSDEMALAGSQVLLENGIRSREQMAVASYEDSALARTHRPAITAIGRSAVQYGRVAATRLLEIIDADRRRPLPDASAAATGEERAIDPQLRRADRAPTPVERPPRAALDRHR